MSHDFYADAFDDESQADDMNYTADQVDDMLDALIDSEADDLSERTRSRSRNRGRGAAPMRSGPVSTATGSGAYRAPTPQGPVTQAQLKEALGRVGQDVRRNAEGIKTVNAQLGRISAQVKDVVAVNAKQGQRVTRMDKQMRLDGAIDFATSFSVVNDGTTTSLVPNLSQLLRGSLKTGVIGADPKGMLTNPFLIGGLAFILNNPQILGGLLGGKTS